MELPLAKRIYNLVGIDYFEIVAVSEGATQVVLRAFPISFSRSSVFSIPQAMRIMLSEIPNAALCSGVHSK
jgi:hypothetical protein